MLAGLASTQLTSKSGSAPSAHQRSAIQIMFHLWTDNGLLAGLEGKNEMFATLCAQEGGGGGGLRQSRCSAVMIKCKCIHLALL